MSHPRVLLADDHTLVLEGFRRLLEEHCELVGTAEDGRSLLEAAERLQPDLVLLDISMPRLNGIDAARMLKKQHPAMKFIFVTMHAGSYQNMRPCETGIKFIFVKKFGHFKTVYR